MKPVSAVPRNDPGSHFLVAAVLLVQFIQFPKIIQLILVLLELGILDSQLVDLLFELLVFLQDDPQLSELVHPDRDPCADAADTILKRDHDIADQLVQR